MSSSKVYAVGATWSHTGVTCAYIRVTNTIGKAGNHFESLVDKVKAGVNIDQLLEDSSKVLYDLREICNIPTDTYESNIVGLRTYIAPNKDTLGKMRKFLTDKNVTLVQGDSAEWQMVLVGTIAEEFLDYFCPVVAELPAPKHGGGVLKTKESTLPVVEDKLYPVLVMGAQYDKTVALIKFPRTTLERKVLLKTMQHALIKDGLVELPSLIHHTDESIDLGVKDITSHGLSKIQFSENGIEGEQPFNQWLKEAGIDLSAVDNDTVLLLNEDNANDFSAYFSLINDWTRKSKDELDQPLNPEVDQRYLSDPHEEPQSPASFEAHEPRGLNRRGLNRASQRRRSVFHNPNIIQPDDSPVDTSLDYLIDVDAVNLSLWRDNPRGDLMVSSMMSGMEESLVTFSDRTASEWDARGMRFALLGRKLGVDGNGAFLSLPKGIRNAYATETGFAATTDSGIGALVLQIEGHDIVFYNLDLADMCILISSFSDVADLSFHYLTDLDIVVITDVEGARFNRHATKVVKTRITQSHKRRHPREIF